MKNTMMRHAGFHDLMKELLRYMQINPSAKTEPEVYAFTFDGKIEVKMFNSLPGMLDIVVLTLGALKNEGAQAVMLKLLELNYYTADSPCLSVGLDPSSGKACLWTRQSLADMNLQKLVDLLHRTLDRAAVARQHLDGKPTLPATAFAGGRRSLNLRLQVAPRLLEP